jgi:hypothetical protein
MIHKSYVYIIIAGMCHTVIWDVQYGEIHIKCGV